MDENKLAHKELSPEGKIKFVKKLEQLGFQTQRDALWNGIPAELRGKEEISPFLLLVAALDQQVEWTTAWRAANNLFEVYGEKLILDAKYMLDDMAGAIEVVENADYRITLPGTSWMRTRGYILSRLAGVFYFLRNEENLLSRRLGSFENVLAAKENLLKDLFISAALDDKALNMYLCWVGHPGLGVDVSDGRWGVSLFDLSVDGHSAKLISRSGILSAQQIIPDPVVRSEDKIKIVAHKMRRTVNEIVDVMNVDKTMVDFAAFFFGKYCCDDISPACNSCNKQIRNNCEILNITKNTNCVCNGLCPLNELCAKNLQWVGYRTKPKKKSTEILIRELLHEYEGEGLSSSNIIEKIQKSKKVKETTIKNKLQELERKHVIKKLHNTYLIVNKRTHIVNKGHQ